MRVRMWMRLCVLVLGLLTVGVVARAQTADRTAVAQNPATAAPQAHPGTYTVQNGQLIVAPGLRIPNGNVPWALDTVNGKQVLVPVHHSALTSNAAVNTLAGQGPRTPLHSDAPVFFVHTSDRTENAGDSGRGTPTGWALLPVQVNDGTRTLERVKFADVTSATVCSAPVVCLHAESLPDGWLRMTVQQPLAAGQYALLPVQRVAPVLAYDFIVDAEAPAPKDAVSPGQNLDAAPAKKKKH